MLRIKISTAFLLIGFCISTFAVEPLRFDTSKAWFKPQLLVSNEPGLCSAVFKSYSDYFATPGAINPIIPIANRSWEQRSPRLLPPSVEEMEWSDVSDRGSNPGLRILEWQESNKYLAILERSTAIGWRPPTYEYFLANKKFTEDELSRITEDGFRDSSLSRFGTTIAFVANVYKFHERTYIAFLEDESSSADSSRYVIKRAISPNEQKLTCKFTLLPSPAAIQKELSKVAHYEEFNTVVWDIMGGAGNCGTLNSHSWASHDLRDSLNTLMFRPWTFSPEPEKYDLSDWGYSGAWNYRKYLKFNSVLPKFRLALADRYVRNYQLDKKKAIQLADDAIEGALARGYGHGITLDSNRTVHQALLEGTAVEVVGGDIPDADSLKEPNGESLLTYALGHSHLVEQLLKEHHDPNAGNAFGKTPLMYAAQFNDLESAKLLVKYGANTELATSRPPDDCSYTIQTHGVTALHYAVRYASREFIEWLVDIGAVTSVQDSNGNTPLDYLTKFGGYVGHQVIAEQSYGQQNKLLTKSQIDALAVKLAPLDARRRQTDSDVANRQAESLYHFGKYQASYVAVKRALSLNPKNQRALSNLSLIALKLGYLGESAKASSEVIKNAQTDNERAAAYFNLGLACQEAGKKYHRNTIDYDGNYYCGERGGIEQGAMHYFLKSYQVVPNKSREDAIVNFLEKTDPGHGKWLCKASESASGPNSIYVTGKSVYFLGKTGKEILFSRFAQRIQGKDTNLEVLKKDEIPLRGGMSVFRWDVKNMSYGPLILGDRVCGILVPVMIKDGAELIQIYSNNQTSDIRSNAIVSEMTKPVMLALLGSNVEWLIYSDLDNISAIFVDGTAASVKYLGRSKPPIYIKPYGANIISDLEKSMGLKVGARINVNDIPQLHLTDSTFSNLPMCDRLNDNRCRIH